MARVFEALNVAPATPVADALVVTCVGGQGMGEQSTSQNNEQLDVAGAIFNSVNVRKVKPLLMTC